MGGILIVTRDHIPINTILNMRLYAAGSEEPLEIKGKVLWNAQSDHEEYLHHGISFLEMSEACSKQVLACLNSELEESD